MVLIATTFCMFNRYVFSSYGHDSLFFKQHKQIYIVFEHLNCQSMKSFIHFLSVLSLLCLIFFMPGCKPDKIEDVVLQGDVADPEVATKWADMTLQAVYRLPGNTPTYCSRALGYLGLTMYESVVQGSLTHQSITKQLNNPATLPQIESGKRYNWQLSLNAGQARMLKKLYAFSVATKTSIDSLEAALEKQYAATETPDVIERSKTVGQSIADAIFAWSTTDGGFEGKVYYNPSNWSWNRSVAYGKCRYYGD
jgi:hypothetical protein